MLDVSARLRAAKEKAEKVKEAHEHGRRWAKKFAEKSELQELEAVFANPMNYYIDLPNVAYSPGENFFFLISPEKDGDREAADEFWNGVIPDAHHLADGAAWVNAFIKGALEAWEEMKDRD
ncbi:MAG: hypothetical protein M5U26_13230 [Planctomycetota bacterium]|nr:hypothetical protein [Planctomycetota bacterium]